MCGGGGGVPIVKDIIGGGGGGGGGGSPAPQPQPQTPAPSATAIPSRPAAAQEAPAYLQLAGAMTPVQQRARIATGGVAGDNSMWRDPETVAFYKNLALRSLLSEGGAPSGGEVLPTEREYLNAILGEQVGPSVNDFLAALGRL